MGCLDVGPFLDLISSLHTWSFPEVLWRPRAVMSTIHPAKADRSEWFLVRFWSFWTFLVCFGSAWDRLAWKFGWPCYNSNPDRSARTGGLHDLWNFQDPTFWKSGIWKYISEIWKLKTWNLKIWNLEIWKSQISNLKIWKSQISNLKIWKSQISKSENLKIWKSQISNLKIWKSQISIVLFNSTIE